MNAHLRAFLSKTTVLSFSRILLPLDYVLQTRISQFHPKTWLPPPPVHHRAERVSVQTLSSWVSSLTKSFLPSDLSHFCTVNRFSSLSLAPQFFSIVFIHYFYFFKGENISFWPCSPLLHAILLSVDIIWSLIPRHSENPISLGMFSHHFFYLITP